MYCFTTPHLGSPVWRLDSPLGISAAVSGEVLPCRPRHAFASSGNLCTPPSAVRFLHRHWSASHLTARRLRESNASLPPYRTGDKGRMIESWGPPLPCKRLFHHLRRQFSACSGDRCVRGTRLWYYYDLADPFGQVCPEIRKQFRCSFLLARPEIARNHHIDLHIFTLPGIKG